MSVGLSMAWPGEESSSEDDERIEAMTTKQGLRENARLSHNPLN